MISLCENRTSGHHKIYFTSLLKIKNTHLVLINKIIVENQNNPFQYFFSRKKILTEYFRCLDKGIIHILTVDYLYVIPLLRKKCNSLKKIVATLHHVPSSKIKLLLLKNFSKKINILVVHSKYLKNKLLKIGITNVKVVNYPSFYDYSRIDDKALICKKYNIPFNKIIISTLGGTRFDKGLDILISSFKYLDSNIKDKILLNIAGKEEYFKQDYIEKNINHINIRINLKILSDQEFCENIKMTDIMIMPYRKSFGGNSGPMTEAIVNRIPCIAPKELNIGEIVDENNIGETFICEDPVDLARAIEKVFLHLKEYYTTDFYRTLTEKSFLEEYEKIYKDLEV